MIPAQQWRPVPAIVAVARCCKRRVNVVYGDDLVNCFRVWGPAGPIRNGEAAAMRRD
jgi:hypothetical protein